MPSDQKTGRSTPVQVDLVTADAMVDRKITRGTCTKAEVSLVGADLTGKLRNDADWRAHFHDNLLQAFERAAKRMQGCVCVEHVPEKMYDQ